MAQAYEVSRLADVLENMGVVVGEGGTECDCPACRVRRGEPPHDA